MTTHFTLIQQVTTLIIDSVLLLQDQAIIQLVKYIQPDQACQRGFLQNIISKPLKLDMSQCPKTQFTVLREDCHLLAKETTDTYCQSFSSQMTTLSEKKRIMQTSPHVIYWQKKNLLNIYPVQTQLVQKPIWPIYLEASSGCR